MNAVLFPQKVHQGVLGEEVKSAKLRTAFVVFEHGLVVTTPLAHEPGQLLLLGPFLRVRECDQRPGSDDSTLLKRLHFLIHISLAPTICITCAGNQQCSKT